MAMRKPKYTFGGVEGDDLKSLAAHIIEDNEPGALKELCDEIQAQLIEKYTPRGTDYDEDGR